MMALDSALVILMAEALATIVLLVGVMLFILRKKRNKEINAINSFINQMDEQSELKNQPLDHLLSKTCGLSGKQVQETLEHVSNCERAVMQKVIELFLKRDMVLLNEIDRAIGDLSEPYCHLLTKMAATDQGSLPVNTQSLERINQQLVRQLDTAMQTIDEITAEYTRVFSGNQTELELENSSKKMLQIFQDSIRTIKQNSQE